MSTSTLAGRHAWQERDIRALGTRTTGQTACEIVYGVGRTKAQQMLRRGECEFRVLRVGRRYVVPVIDILRLLGLDGDQAAGRSENSDGAPA